MELAPGATSLVIRTSQDYRYDSLLSMLQFYCHSLWASSFPIDFIYLPCPRVGIVNFLNHELCRICFETILQHMEMATIRIIKVQQAMYQGLQANLAVYYAKAGRRGLERKNAPKVFLEGQELPLRQALKSFVTQELIQQFRATFRSSAEASSSAARRNDQNVSRSGRRSEPQTENWLPEPRLPSSSSSVPDWQRTELWEAALPVPMDGIHLLPPSHKGKGKMQINASGRRAVAETQAYSAGASTISILQPDGSVVFRL